MDSKVTEISLAVSTCFLLAFEKKVVFPATVTYLRAGSIKKCKGVKNPCVDLSQARSSRAESPQSCLALAGLQALDHFPGLSMKAAQKPRSRLEAHPLWEKERFTNRQPPWIFTRLILCL